MMDEDRDTALFDEGEEDMETDRVDATSHNRESVKNVLERKLSNRAPKQELMDKNILPVYTSSPVLHAQTSSLERQKKNDELQKKIRQRPDQDELVQMNILKNTTSVHPSLQANQTQLKRAVTANSLSQKIASRPGPLSLIQKGILDPANNCLVGAVKQLPLPTGEELDDGGVAANSAALQQGLQQKKRQQQRHSVATMGGQSGQVSSQSSSPFHSGDWNKLTSPISRSMSADVVEDGHEERLRKGSSSSSIPSPPEFLCLESPAHSPSGSVGVRSPPTSSVSFRSLQSGRSINKIPTVSPKLCKKQIKSKREKFRFHIYQPPNQKRNMKEVPQKQRSPYSLLVQQQQILLQLQVLQQQHPEMMNTGINFPPIPSDCSPQQHMQILLQTLHKMTENRANFSSSIPTSKSSPPFSSELILQKDNSPLSLMTGSQQHQQQQKTSTTSMSFTSESLIQCDNGKKVKFEDVRVNNLKEACKEKKLVVSGKKAELVERLLEHNNGVLPASVMERKDVGPEGRTTTPQELLSSVPTTSPIFKFPSNQPDNVTAPIRTNYMHIKKIQDRFDEENQKKKLHYISGNSYSGPIAPMPDTVPARYTVQHQKLTNQVPLSMATNNNSSVMNNSLSHAYACESQSHQPLIKKKSLSEPSSPILSPTSPLTLLTEMISGDSSSMLNPPTSRQQLDTISAAVKQQYTAQPCNGVAGSSVVYNSGSNSTLMTNDDEILFRTKVTPAQPNHRAHRKSLPVLPPYMTGPSVAMKQQVTSAGNSSEYQYSDGSDLYDANGLPVVVDSSDQLMDIGTDPSFMGMLDMNGGEGYQNNASHSNKPVTDSNPLDFLTMGNPFVMGRSASPKDIPPPPYTNSHPTANPDLSWMTSYGASPVHSSMAFLSQSLTATATERYHNSEHNKSNLNNIQPFLDSDLPVPNLDLFSSADTEKYLSMSM